MSGQNNKSQDWRTPSVAQQWQDRTPPPQSNRPRESGPSSRSPKVENLRPTYSGAEMQRVNNVIDAPSASSGNERERSSGDPRKGIRSCTRDRASGVDDNVARQTRSSFSTDPATKKLGDGKTAENGQIDASGNPVESENARYICCTRRGRRITTLRSGPARGVGPVGRGKSIRRGGSVW
ncbi:hypothetical protein BCON_0015g00320 [Botryotinia convoluta]|uniref:Uncharacterized protein n=1 Tax=Botryotinia convoluta TaxID=54673 RepID=A0A4Z1J1Q8_9HELO|nr:hypothetical protein BCON_0015g00320 [Botryotinia convoluta]